MLKRFLLRIQCFECLNQWQGDGLVLVHEGRVDFKFEVVWQWLHILELGELSQLGEDVRTTLTSNFSEDDVSDHVDEDEDAGTCAKGNVATWFLGVETSTHGTCDLVQVLLLLEIFVQKFGQTFVSLVALDSQAQILAIILFHSINDFLRTFLVFILSKRYQSLKDIWSHHKSLRIVALNSTFLWLKLSRSRWPSRLSRQ